MSSESSGNVKVICRFRPLNQKEIQSSEPLAVNFSSDRSTVIVTPRQENASPFRFTLDKIFPPNSTQAEVYDSAAKPIVQAVMQGFNGTVFAYGQTSSGKTYTMTGPDVEDEELMGIIPRMVGTVFTQIEEQDQHIEYSVKVSYSEIYLEKIRDLLDPSKANLKIHEDRNRGVFVADLTENYVSSEQEVYELMKIGSRNREVASTHMNAGSSRSHSIFMLTISQTNTLDYSAKTGKLYLVDLAGSEKVGKTGAEGKRLEEANHINKSLTTLGHVIYSLTDGKSSHIPYRDSKLTRVLQDSLGGNSKTALIITCSPSAYNESETLSTLRFGDRAKSIKNRPKVNKEYTVAELKLMLANAREEIAKRDRTIVSLTKAIQDSGIDVLTESPMILENLPPQEESAMDDVILELEEVRNRLSEEVEEHSQLKQTHAKLQEEHDFLNEEFENLKLVCQIQKQNILQREANDEEREDLLETLKITKESLEHEFEEISVRKLSIERRNHTLEETELTPSKHRRSKTVRFLFENELNLANTQVKTLEDKVSKMKKKCKLYRNSMNLDEVSLVKKTETLENNLGQLELMYHQLASQRSCLRVDNQIYQRKLDRMNKNNQDLLDENIKLKEEVLNDKLEIKRLVEQIEQLTSNSNNAFATHNIIKNIKRPIRGGSRRGTTIINTFTPKIIDSGFDFQ